MRPFTVQLILIDHFPWVEEGLAVFIEEKIIAKMKRGMLDDACIIKPDHHISRGGLFFNCPVICAVESLYKRVGMHPFVSYPRVASDGEQGGR